MVILHTLVRELLKRVKKYATPTPPKNSKQKTKQKSR